MATAKKTSPFADLRCPHCGEVNSLDVRVETLVLECRECSEAISQDVVAIMIERWQKLFAWIDSASK